jgi:glucosylceramidase
LFYNSAQTVEKTIKNNEITVYTTAENTDFKLTQTASINFVGQPLETQISVLLTLLNLQTFVGIGGAISGR